MIYIGIYLNNKSELPVVFSINLAQIVIFLILLTLAEKFLLSPGLLFGSKHANFKIIYSFCYQLNACVVTTDCTKCFCAISDTPNSS